jgi:hypothetical protein
VVHQEQVVQMGSSGTSGTSEIKAAMKMAVFYFKGVNLF